MASETDKLAAEIAQLRKDLSASVATRSEISDKLIKSQAENVNLKKDIQVLENTMGEHDVNRQGWEATLDKRLKVVEDREKDATRREKAAEENAKVGAKVNNDMLGRQHDARELGLAVNAVKGTARSILSVLKEGLNTLRAAGVLSPESLASMFETMVATKLSNEVLERKETDQAELFLAQQAELDYEWSEVRKKKEELEVQERRLFSKEEELVVREGRLIKKQEELVTREGGLLNELVVRKERVVKKEEELAIKEKALDTAHEVIADAENYMLEVAEKDEQIKKAAEEVNMLSASLTEREAEAFVKEEALKLRGKELEEGVEKIRKLSASLTGIRSDLLAKSENLKGFEERLAKAHNKHQKRKPTPSSSSYYSQVLADVLVTMKRDANPSSYHSQMFVDLLSSMKMIHSAYLRKPSGKREDFIGSAANYGLEAAGKNGDGLTIKEETKEHISQHSERKLRREIVWD